jgi:hypothetical protein
MALMMGSLYEALKEGGTSDARAKAAAEEVARHEHRFSDLHTEMVERFSRVDERFAKVDERFAKVEGQLRLHSWILSFNTAMLVAILLRLFWP